MTRDEARAELPFYINGSLPASERDEVARWLETDAELRREAETLQAVRARMQEAPVDSPGAAGLDRLMDRLDRETPANLPRPPRRLQIAAALLAAVVVVQALLLVREAGDPGGYQLAGDEAASVTVAFRPDGTEADIRALLLEAGLVIVDGPSALGFYGLAPLDGVDPDDAVARLRASELVTDIQQEAAP